MTISVQNKVTNDSFEGQSSIYCSLITFRNLLPLIIEDKGIFKSVNDSIINGASVYVLSFSTYNSLPNYLGTKFEKVTKESEFIHRLVVDPIKMLPMIYQRTKLGSQDTIRLDYSQINLNPNVPKENSWYYSDYEQDYKHETINNVEHISVGMIAPNWILTDLKNDEQRELTHYKGKFLLIEFWIKNCGYCIQAVDRLNALKMKYPAELLDIVAINTNDTRLTAKMFSDRHNANYTTLWSDTSNIRQAYGISAYPTIVLVDSSGIVVHVGDLDHDRISSIIDKTIEL